MKKKIISAGHICIDITPEFPAGKKVNKVDQLLIPGKLIHVEHATVSTGGSVANTGLALKLLGNDVTLMGKVGADAFGDLVKEIVASHGAGGLLTDPESSTSYSVVLAMPGIDRIFLHNPGANDTFTASDIPEDGLKDAALFHFGYPPLMKKMFEDDGEELLKIFRNVKEHGIATSLDMAAPDPESDAGHAHWEEILRKVLPYVDFFVPSFEELSYMLNRNQYERLTSSGKDMTENLDIEKEVKPLAEKAIALGCRAIVIKCGSAGMYYRTASLDKMKDVGKRLELNADDWAEKEGIQPCFKADCVKSATGAGDTSIAAYLTALLQGYTPEDCAALAAAEGACSVTTYDSLSGLKPLSELEKRIASGWETT